MNLKKQKNKTIRNVMVQPQPNKKKENITMMETVRILGICSSALIFQTYMPSKFHHFTQRSGISPCELLLYQSGLPALCVKIEIYSMCLTYRRMSFIRHTLETLPVGTLSLILKHEAPSDGGRVTMCQSRLLCLLITAEQKRWPSEEPPRGIFGMVGGFQNVTGGLSEMGACG